MDGDYVDLSKLNRCSRGIDWRNSNGCQIAFCYHNITGIMFLKDNVDLDNVIVTYLDKDYTLSKCCLTNCHLGKIFNLYVKDNFHYNNNDVIQRNSPLRIVEQKRIKSNKVTVKGYTVECQSCKSVFDIREGNLEKGDGCPYCGNRKIKVGFNDLWTTRPDIAVGLMDPKDGYLYSKYSNAKVKVKCPICNTYIGERSICDITAKGFSCHKCSDGISFPNKFMFNLLTCLSVNFLTEVKFEWCKFKLNDYSDHETYGIYDFVLPDIKTIIEMDSGLGHGNNVFKCKKEITKNESIYRDQQKERLAKEHGYHVIRVNCAYYGSENKFDICKNAIIASEVASIYDLSNIDWMKIYTNSLNSYVVESCRLYNNGTSLDTIANKLHLTVGTIQSYIKVGTECHLCNL